MDKTKFKVKTGCFGATSEDEKAEILKNRLAKNTRRSTNIVVTCLIEYLAAKKFAISP